MSTYDALVVGAGPAGLATSRELSLRGVSHVVLEQGDQVGLTWARLYDNLVLHTAKRLSALPGLPFPPGTPLFPTRADVLTYLHRYAETFRVPLETRAEVEHLRRAGGLWTARTTGGIEITARAVVVATGIVSNPHVPAIPGRSGFDGRVCHSVDYLRPDGYAGRRVLIVGAGNSAGEIAVELARAGVDVTLAVRTGASVVPRTIAGIPIQCCALVLATLPPTVQRAMTTMMARVSDVGAAVSDVGAAVSGVGAAFRRPAPDVGAAFRRPSIARSPVLPRPRPGVGCPRIPMIGFHLVDALRAGTICLKGGVTEFTASGARFTDDSVEPFDEVVLATGYRAAVGMLRDVIQLDECGFALRRERVVSVDCPDLYFVGHNYDMRGALFNIGRDGRLAAARITSTCAETSRTSTGTPRRRSETRWGLSRRATAHRGAAPSR